MHTDLIYIGHNHRLNTSLLAAIIERRRLLSEKYLIVKQYAILHKAKICRTVYP